ncbi:PAS domain-containing protein [Pseudalkalibacillus caeni]|nr:PAS domain-containing protein [Pseudalkalibacillus caeni]
MGFFEHDETTAVLNTIGENIFIADTDFNIVWINDYAENLIHNLNPYIKVNSRSELLGKNIKMFHPENGEKQIQILKEGPFPYKTTINLFNRYTANLVIDRLFVKGKIKGYVLTWKDITEFEQKVADIKQALDRSSIVAFMDNEGTITYANKKFCELSGYRMDELVGNNYSLVESGYHTDAFFNEMWETIKSGKLWNGIIKNKTKHGRYFWVQTTIHPFLNPDGQPYKHAVIQTDITEAKETEEMLKKTLKKLSDIEYALDESSILSFLDRNFMYTYVNDKFCEISRYRREELLGQSAYMLESDNFSEKYNKAIFETAENGNVWKGEVLKKAKDGSSYWVHLTLVPLLDDKGIPYKYVTIQHDITSKKQAEELVQRTEKLSAIGELAAGVAHEIRNPLTSIKGFTQLMDRNEQYKQIILEEIERINFIVSEFMVLAKPHSVKFSEHNIISLVNHVVSLLSSEANLKNIVLVSDFETATCLVEGEQNQLKQVFLNLLKNAIDAMPAGGKIVVKQRAVEGKVQISVTDEGQGIPPENIKKLGEPFYSTKEKGTGLGLMVSFRIIQNHNGKIDVESELDKGTTFTITLPCVD